jgi:hypothetical protein
MHSIQPACVLFAPHPHDQFYVELAPGSALDLVEADILPSPRRFHTFSPVFHPVLYRLVVELLP